MRALLWLTGRPQWAVPRYTPAQKAFIEQRFWALLAEPVQASTHFSWRRLSLHIQRLLGLWQDLPSYLLRKKTGQVLDVRSLLASHPEKGEFRNVPDYLKLNMHFQTDGYFSERSAFLYDHQIEILFLGVAELARKVGFELLQGRLSPNASCMEFGCGNGTSGRQFKEVFPGVELTGVGVSSILLLTPLTT